MKITFVLDTADMAGGTRVVAIYADRLQRRGHEVTVVSTPFRRPSLRDRLRSVRQGRGWPAAQMPHRPASHLDSLNIDHRLINKWRPIISSDVPDADVVVATWWQTAEWVNALAASKGAKAYLVQHHEVIFDGQPRERVAATWRLPMHKIAVSRWLKDVAREEYGDAGASLVPNSVNAAQFNAPVRGRRSKPTLGFLYHTYSKFKGYEVAIDAIEGVRKQIPGLQIVSFGNQGVWPEMPLPAGTQYTESPAQDHLKDIYSQCDVWLCASHSEGFGLTVLEAMACRCPAVSTRVGGTMDFIIDGMNGYLVDPGDAVGLADRLSHVLKMPGVQWQQMSEAACETANRYTWDDATTLLERAFELAIVRSSAPASAALRHELAL